MKPIKIDAIKLGQNDKSKVEELRIVLDNTIDLNKNYIIELYKQINLVPNEHILSSEIVVIEGEFHIMSPIFTDLMKNFTNLQYESEKFDDVAYTNAFAIISLN